MLPTDSPPAALEPQARNRDFLDAAMRIVVVGCAVGVALVLAMGPQQYSRLVGLGLAALAAGGTLLALKRGDTARAYGILTYGLWFGVTVTAAINGGMTAPAVLAYPVLILVAGWIMGTRTVLVLAGLSIAAEAAFAVGALRGWLPERPPTPPLLTLFAHGLVLTVAASLSLFVRRSFAARFAEIARRDAELSAKHALLSEIVEGTARTTGVEFFHALVQHLARALDVPFALIGEVRPDEPGKLHTLAFWAQDGFAATIDYDLATTPCGQVFGQGSRLFGQGLAQRFPQAACMIEALGADSYCGFPLTDAAGNPLGVLAIMDRRPLAESEERASLMSIFAARAAAELERQRAEAGERLSEQKFERIVRASPVPISITRLADGLYREVNQAYEEKFGWARDEMIGRTSADIKLWADPDRRRAWVEALRRDGRVANFEAMMRNREGEVRIILVSAEILDFGGEECGLAFFHDITEHKRAERWIRELNADLEERVRRRTAELTEANRELESFAYSISHDLRAPLRGIDGFSRLLQEEYGERLDAQGTDYLVRVRRAAQRLGTLIDDLLDLSRVTRHEMQRVKVDLSALATDIVDNLRRTEPERTVTVGIRRRCSTYGDPRLLRVLLENLLDNAWKYSSRAEHAHIEFGAETAGEDTVYFVRDNGAGFDMAYADKLFVPFQRLHNPADFQGSGVGLASAARIVRRHGGKIWAESVPGQGAVFRFTLGNQ